MKHFTVDMPWSIHGDLEEGSYRASVAADSVSAAIVACATGMADSTEKDFYGDLPRRQKYIDALTMNQSRVVEDLAGTLGARLKRSDALLVEAANYLRKMLSETVGRADLAAAVLGRIEAYQQEQS
jgi:hypothetical protein